jgi:hypothetical protein
MAQPTLAQVHIDVPLTQISVAYTQSADNFIAGKVFPDVNVEKQSNKYFTFDRTTFMRDQMRKRAAGEESAGSGYTLSNDSYFCDVFALHKDISDFDRTNTDSPLDADRNAVTFLTQAALVRKEAQWVSDYFATGIWGTDNTSTTKWSDYVSSDPIGDLDVAKVAMLEATAQEGNTLILGLRVFNQLKNHPDIVDRIKYTSSRVVTEDVLASLFGVGRVLVPKAVSDGVAEGKTAAPALMHGKHALLLHVAPSPGLEVASAGYTFNWTGFASGFSGQGVAVSKFRMENLKSDRVEAHVAFDLKVVASQLGYFWSSVVT